MIVCGVSGLSMLIQELSFRFDSYIQRVLHKECIFENEKYFVQGTLKCDVKDECVTMGGNEV